MAMMACRRPSLARQSQWLLGLLLLSGIVSFSGCTSLGLNLLTRKKPLLHADAKHPVMDVICLWEAAEGQNLDGLPCRGFAGQVLFFAHGHSEPVLVDGAVTVYVFDDQGDASEQSRPMHEFHFEGPAWNTYGRESSLGAAYQLFVPYTRPGSHHAACAIRVKYQPEGTERATFSKMANVILPGEKSDRADASMTRRRGSARSACVALSEDQCILRHTALGRAASMRLHVVLPVPLEIDANLSFHISNPLREFASACGHGGFD